jgi:hypothetical protein
MAVCTRLAQRLGHGEAELPLGEAPGQQVNEVRLDPQFSCRKNRRQQVR